ncbi:hypothetical protein UCRNP2_6615 [Neofusicoccum parvum UCRNP2]|uniref:Zn(2)-C6 fungal-type domain-containing protein n=1 Tax=Botryosphaeria parva (strain UCR-NP2) TaxID=1287680 RepID=R1EGL6_BOTPV|nr:hypothetical protein UCRNP2_6615 [Neofusicoccum parvum UCRNP2]
MADESDKYRSFRLACDRCRSHKLKCPQNPVSATGACQRCTRAKAQCTFSPRARAAKSTQDRASTAAPGRAIQKPGKRGGSASPSVPGSPPPTALDTPQLQQDQQPGSGSSKWDSPWGELGSFAMLHASPRPHFHSASEVSPSDFSAAMTMNSTFMDCSPFTDAASGSGMDGTPFDFQFDIEQLGVLPDPDGPNALGASSVVDQMREEDGDVLMASVSKDVLRSHDEDCTKKLSALAVEFQRHLMLVNQHSAPERGPSEKSSQHWLSTYPIGEILFLSGEFVSTLEPEIYPNGREGVSIDENDPTSPGCASRVGHHGHLSATTAPIGSDIPISKQRYPNSPESMAPAPGISSAPASTSLFRGGGVDTPTALLILNCYVSMIRIYSALFAHLHEHLHSLVPARRHSYADRANPGLKFGELPPTDDGSIRTYTAVRLLLDALQRSEELLDLPNDLRCVRALVDEGSSSDSEVESVGSGHSRSLTPCSRDIIGSELARAVFRQEAHVGAENGGGGLDLLRKNIEGVKRSLRQRMAL